MNTIFVHRDGRTESATSIDRSWLGPALAGKPLYLWVDLAAPTIPESLVLTDSFAFHLLAVEAARAERQMPTIDAFAGYLFAVVAGADTDISVFVGPHYIVSVHRAESKAIVDQIDSVRHGGKQFNEGPFAMFHRLVNATVDGLAQVVQTQRSGADGLEKRLLEKATPEVVRDVLRARSDAFGLGQRLACQQEAVGRLARREIVEISDEMAIRFRRVHHHLAQLTGDLQGIDHRLGALLTAAGLVSKKGWM
jgi:magnesium transporter